MNLRSLSFQLIHINAADQSFSVFYKLVLFPHYSPIPRTQIPLIETAKEAAMKDVEKLFGTAVNEIERMLNTKTVVGEPITVEGNTLIPLVSVGFGFGVGGGEGTDPSKGAGTGGGTGGGGGVKPVALIIINKDGVRVEPIKGATVSVIEKIAESVGKATSAKTADV